MAMPKTQPGEATIRVRCDQVPPCDWESPPIAPRMKDRVLGLHRALKHKVFSTDPNAMAKREARQARRGEVVHPCEVPGCKERFSRLWDRDEHRRKDHGPKPFTCQFCGDTFTTYKYWRRHEDRICLKRPQDASLPVAPEPAPVEQPEAPQVIQEAAPPANGVEVDPTALAQALVETLRSLMAEKARGEWEQVQSPSGTVALVDHEALEALADEQARSIDRLKQELRGLQDSHKALQERHAEMRTAYVKLENKEHDTAVELGRQKTINKQYEEQLAENRALAGRRNGGSGPRPLSNPVLSQTEVGALNQAAARARSR